MALLLGARMRALYAHALRREGPRLEVGEWHRRLAGADLVAGEAEPEAEDLCFLSIGVLVSNYGLLGSVVCVCVHTSRACSRVSPRGRDLTGAAILSTTSGSVAIVTHEASLAEVSKTELASGLWLGERDS